MISKLICLLRNQAIWCYNGLQQKATSKTTAAACHTAAPLASSLRTYTPVGTLVAFLIIVISEVVLHTSVAVVSALDYVHMLTATAAATTATATAVYVHNSLTRAPSHESIAHNCYAAVTAAAITADCMQMITLSFALRCQKLPYSQQSVLFQTAGAAACCCYCA
eukprot:14644-Heterococcus_DN1.PRE.2